MEAGAGIRMDSSLQKLCYQWIQKNEITDDLWSLNVYFGTCKEKGLERIARFIFENYPAPLLRVTLNTRHKNQIIKLTQIYMIIFRLPHRDINKAHFPSKSLH